jgi:drug/metabolite transporter (DMT)-like permease
MPQSRADWLPYLVLALGVFAVSWGAILVRLAAVPALVVGAYRLVMASLILTPLAWSRNGEELRRLSRRDLSLILVSGLFLGMHFATWISSLTYTSVASSVVLVNTAPLFVGLAMHFVFREQLSSQMVAGITLATLGGAIIGWDDFRVSGWALWGDILAVLGAMGLAAYFLIGRDLRRRLSLLTYITPTYWTAAVVLTAAMLCSRQNVAGYPLRAYVIILLMAIGPQVIGHSSFNWALGYLSPAFVTVSILGEPIGSSILAHVVLGESPSRFEALGGAVILAGIYLCSRAEAAGGTA